MRNVIPRLGAAAPDCLTSATYLVAWITPTQLDPAQFRNLLAAIMIEFLVLHASALYGFGIAKREARLANAPGFSEGSAPSISSPLPSWPCN